VRLENTSGAPLKLPAAGMDGPTATRWADDKMHPERRLDVDDGMPSRDRRAGSTTPRSVCVGATAATPAGISHRFEHVVWASVHNQFFRLVALPKGTGPAKSCPRPLELAADRAMTKCRPNQKNCRRQKDANRVRLPVGTSSWKAVERQFNFFAGPKGSQRGHIANRFQNNVDFGHGLRRIFWLLLQGLYSG